MVRDYRHLDRAIDGFSARDLHHRDYQFQEKAELNFQFYGYTVRSTVDSDLATATHFTMTDLRHNDPLDIMHADAGPGRNPALFWLKQGKGCQSLVVFDGQESREIDITDGSYTVKLPLAFFQIQHVGKGDQVRLAFQASPVASPKSLLRGITKLVPLIEKALALRGVRAIFFTSHSLTMVRFMEKLGYSLQPYIDGGADGVVMAKQLTNTKGLPSAADLDAIRERTQ